MSRMLSAPPPRPPSERATASHRASLSRPEYWLKLALLTAVYYGAARVGVLVAVEQGDVTPVWAPAGIAVAALLLFGLELWPAIALGTLLEALTGQVPPVLGLGAGVANVLESVAAALALRRLFDFHTSLDRVRDVGALVVVALVTPMISATGGITALVVGGLVPPSAYGSAWALWWLGDVMGILLVAPLILSWVSQRENDFRGWKAGEALLLVALLASAAWLAFFSDAWGAQYLIFPLMAWAALRFRQRGATAAVFVVFLLALLATVSGSALFGGRTEVDRVVLYQVATSVFAVAVYLLAATRTSRTVQEEAPGRKSWALPGLIAAALLWGLAGVVAGEMFRSSPIDPFELGLGRAIVSTAGLAFVASAWRRASAARGSHAEGASLRRRRSIALLTLGVSLACIHAFLYLALREGLSVTQAMVLAYSSPVIAVIWSSVVARRLPSAAVSTGVCVVVVGVALVAGIENLGDLAVLGVVFALASAVAFASYARMSDRASDTYGPVGATFRAFAVSILFWAVMTAVTRGLPGQLLQHGEFLKVAFLGVGGTLLPFLLFVRGVQYLSPERGLVVATLDPATAAVIAWIWLGESLSALQALGVLLVLGAVVFVQRRLGAEEGTASSAQVVEPVTGEELALSEQPPAAANVATQSR